MSIKGIDTKQPWHDGSVISSYLNQLPVPHPERSQYCFGINHSFNQYQSSLQQLIEGKTLIKKREYELCMIFLKDLRKILQKEKPDFWTELTEAINGMEGWNSQVFYKKNPLAFRLRDEGMFKNIVLYQQTSMEDEKAVLWTHNVHIALRMSEVETDVLKIQGQNSMGTDLHKHYGSKYYALGLISANLGSNTPGPKAKPDSYKASPHSLEKELEKKLSAEAVFLPVSTKFIDLNKPVLFSELHRSSYEKNRNSFKHIAIPARQYHGLLFLRHSPPMELIE